MDDDLQRRLVAALERAHRLGTIGGALDDHIEHSRSFAAAIGGPDDQAVRGVDLGTGGGLPGVVLATVFPMSLWTLVEIRSARADEVERAVARLGLSDRVDVVSAAAQELGQGEWRGSFDVAVARAFGPPPLTAECAAGLLRVGGRLVVSEPPDGGSSPELRWPEGPLARLGFGSPSAVNSRNHRFVELVKVDPTPDEFPRLPPRQRSWP